MPSEALVALRRNALTALLPPPRRLLSEWLEEKDNFVLPEGGASTFGQMRLWPFQREIADAIGDPTIERVTLVKPVRVGFTTLLIGAIGAYVANDPAPILCLLPTEADCRDHMVSEIEPIFEASPALTGLIGGAKDEGGRNTILSRRFPGGSLKLVAAKAPRNLRRHTARVLFCDEVDAMEVGVEGSPLLLAERRTLSYDDRKIVVGSTPVFEETSHVLRSYARSDARIFEVPCPECGAFHEISWADIQWPEGEPERAHYVCSACGSVVEENHKFEMVAAGRWRATQPKIAGHAGFRLNALVSLLANASWGKLAAEFLVAKNDPGLLQTFVNTILAQGWREAGEEIDETALAARAEAFSLDALPEEVLVIVVGVDVQRDRLEATFLGFSRDDKPFVLGHRVVWGLPEDDATWAELDELLKMRFTHPSGGSLGVDATAIDSGDGETMELVYAFAFPRISRKVVAIKGASGNRPWIEASKSKIKGGGRIWIVGVDGIKANITARLSRGDAIRFSDTLPEVWFEQLASERVVVRYTRGQPVRRFERIPGRRAEALDCVVYGFAARQIVNVNFEERAAALKRGEAVAAVASSPPRRVKSRWMQR